MYLVPSGILSLLVIADSGVGTLPCGVWISWPVGSGFLVGTTGVSSTTWTVISTDLSEPSG